MLPFLAGRTSTRCKRETASLGRPARRWISSCLIHASALVRQRADELVHLGSVQERLSQQDAIPLDLQREFRIVFYECCENLRQRFSP